MIRIINLLILTVMLSSCDGESKNNPEPEKKDFDLKSMEVLSASDRFGWELLKTVNEFSETAENVVVSPLSVSQALGMTTNGAAGETLDQMVEVLDFGDVDAMNEAFLNIREVLHSADSRVEIQVANSVWYRQDLPAKDDFREAVEHYYDATFEGLDFSDKDGSKKIINGWVNEKTKGKIPTIIEEVKASQFMFLINAVYFLGKWQYQFEKQATIDQPFYLSNGTQFDVPMMNQKADFAYFENEELKAVKLPYGDGSFYMVLALPNEEGDINDLIDRMNSEKWRNVIEEMAPQELTVFLPRFELECKFELKPSLIAMGMELPFSDYGADFSNMIDAQVFVGEVKHKTYIKVDEEGTEAAAATSVGMEFTSVGPRPVVFRADRPFLFAIAEEKSGAILFSGKVENPAE